MKDIHNQILQELQQVAHAISEEETYQLATQIKRSQRIFIAGEGRSGLMGKAFAMRLMHAGYPVNVIGETVTPSIQKEDLLIVISGSGNTSSLHLIAKQAQSVEATVHLVTTNANSKLGNLANAILRIPAATKYRKEHEPNTIQPLGNQFDQSVHLLMDAIVIALTQENENNEEMMRSRHTNLE